MGTRLHVFSRPSSRRNSRCSSRHKLALLKRSGAVLATTAILATGGIGIASQIRPDLAGYESIRRPEADSTARALTVTFMGVSTLLLDDGETAIMTDGFFTRPGLHALLRFRPDTALIRRTLNRAQVKRLAAVIPVHSHYDHAMDAPYVALFTGAKLIGSLSTRNVGLGSPLPPDSFTLAVKGQPMTFGRFSVTLFEARHVPTGILLFPGEIASPLIPPASVSDYRLGEVYSVVIRHDDRTIVVQGSAGFLPDTLKNVKADVVYLSVARLGKQSREYRDSLWSEVVTATGAKRVIAIHWDDFMRPLSKPLRPASRLLDNLDAAFRFLQSHSKPDTMDIQIAREFVKTDPFAGLPPR